MAITAYSYFFGAVFMGIAAIVWTFASGNTDKFQIPAEVKDAILISYNCFHDLGGNWFILCIRYIHFSISSFAVVD